MALSSSSQSLTIVVVQDLNPEELERLEEILNFTLAALVWHATQVDSVLATTTASAAASTAVHVAAAVAEAIVPSEVRVPIRVGVVGVAVKAEVAVKRCQGILRVGVVVAEAVVAVSAESTSGVPVALKV